MVEQRVNLEKSRRKIKTFRKKAWIIAGAIIIALIVGFSLYSFTDVITGIPEEAESVPQPNEWAMFRHDLSHSGSSGVDETVPEGALKWTFETGGAIHSSPAVADGTVYVGSRDSYLYALDAITGEQKWSFKAGSWVDSSPVVVGGVVYFGCNDSNLYALDAKTGTKLWEFETRYALRSSPAVADGIVYIGGDDHYVYAVDAATGLELWRAGTGHNVLSAPAVSKGVVVVGSVDGMCYTFNAKNGRSRLEYDTVTSIIASPAVKDGVAYVADNAGYFYAIDITGKNWVLENKLKYYWNVLWIYGVAPRPPRPSGHVWGMSLGWGIKSVSSAALADDRAYLGAGNNIVSVDLATQKIAWTFPTPDAVSSSPAVAGNAVLAGGYDGRLYAIDRLTGEKIWDSAAGDKITSSPAVADGMVYIGSHDGRLYAFD